MGKTILLIDDEELVIEIAKKQLEAKGFTVFTAYDGEPALELLKTKPVDLVLLDVQMPKMNGYTFITEFRKLEADKPNKTPIIVLTAFGNMEPIFKRHNIKNYLQKPFQLNELIDKIKQVTGS